jgi:hypothetical protein
MNYFLYCLDFSRLPKTWSEKTHLRHFSNLADSILALQIASRAKYWDRLDLVTESEIIYKEKSLTSEFMFSRIRKNRQTECCTVFIANPIVFSWILVSRKKLCYVSDVAIKLGNQSIYIYLLVLLKFRSLFHLLFASSADAWVSLSGCIPLKPIYKKETSQLLKYPVLQRGLQWVPESWCPNHKTNQH